MKTRLQQELSGELGIFWKKHAQEEISKVEKEFHNYMTMDENGAVKNSLGRYLMDDKIELLEKAGIPINREATQKARVEENRISVEKYRKAQQYSVPKETLAEMQNVFGRESNVVNIITGKKQKIRKAIRNNRRGKGNEFIYYCRYRNNRNCDSRYCNGGKY